MAKMKKVVVGTRKFGNKIDITDPGYDRNVWCRKDNVEIVPGDYECVTWINKDKVKYEDKVYDDVRVGIIGIYLDGIVPAQKGMESFGTIGVDAGLAGFFENKPDYTDEQWQQFCDSIREGNAWIKEEGFFSSSGYDDGEYPVYISKNKAGITALEIRFM